MSAAPVVLIDDTEEDLFLAERLIRFARADNGLLTFLSPVAAVTALTGMIADARLPQVCFVDVKMPQLTGFDVLTWIRSQPELQATPIIMLSGSDEPRDVAEGKRRGANCYLKKYPSVPEMQGVLACVREFRQPTAGHCADFALPCNLLSTLPPLES